MSLTHEFFIARDRALEKYHVQDYLNLDVLIDQGKINFGQLAAANLIQENAFRITAELYEFELTEKGKRYFREIQNHDLLLIKQSKYRKLLSLFAQTIEIQ